MQQIEDKTADFNRYYHQAGDTVDHMDAAYWEAMMRGLVATIATWAGVVPPAATPTALASATMTTTAPATMTSAPATSTATQAATPSAVATDPAQTPVLLPLAHRSRR